MVKSLLSWREGTADESVYLFWLLSAGLHIKVLSLFVAMTITRLDDDHPLALRQATCPIEKQ